jgi:hypothetical protein
MPNSVSRRPLSAFSTVTYREAVKEAAGFHSMAKAFTIRPVPQTGPSF